MWKNETFLAALLLTATSPALACEDMTFEEVPFTICEADAQTDSIRLFLRDEDGAVHGSFGSVDAELAGDGLALRFAMNGGMYHDDRAPVGHYVEDGVEVMRVIPNAGPGNFGMLPNGVFCMRDNRADVFETMAFVAAAPECRYATQSGPMLVIDGELHPRFLPDSTSTFVRNGVGSSADGRRVVFAISNAPVTFHTFARLFRDALGVPNALFLDGNVSRLYDAEAGRSDFGRTMGPILGVVDPNG
ncbi:phosphodiester glycosidase family protein [Primorskyibacter sp. S187A]|uniref:phosphodiester glycosidase family protein n=1 Tax=Primorskyibacter sp. S187A TaxID=3415130 RepID=UPI003C7E386C